MYSDGFARSEIRVNWMHLNKWHARPSSCTSFFMTREFVERCDSWGDRWGHCNGDGDVAGHGHVLAALYCMVFIVVTMSTHFDMFTRTTQQTH